MHDVAREPHHRPHQQAAQREVDERGRRQRDDDGDAENIERVGVHRRLQRRLRHDDLDEVVGIVADAAEHPDRSPIVGEEHRDRVADLLEPQRDVAPEAFRHLAQVVVSVDRHLRIDGQDEAAHALAARCYRLHLRRAQHLGAQARGNVAAGKAFRRERGELSSGQPLVEPGDPVVRDRGQEDEDFRQQDEHRRQQQELRGQAEIVPAPARDLGPLGKAEARHDGRGQ